MKKLFSLFALLFIINNKILVFTSTQNSPPHTFIISQKQVIGPNAVCTVTANLLYANGQFVREITPEEQAELIQYEQDLDEYNKQLAEFLRGAYINQPPGINWVFGGKMIFPRFQNAMPRRPNIPSFCNGRDTIVYQLNGCNVQNYRVYIGNLYVRQLNDDERRELDEYEYRLREYQNGLIENLKKPSAPSWRSSIENQQWNDWHSWAPFRKYANANANMTIISNPETSTTTTTTHRPYVKVEASTITTTNEPITSAQTTTEVPIFTKGLPSKILTSVPPKPPKFCSQIY